MVLVSRNHAIPQKGTERTKVRRIGFAFHDALISLYPGGIVIGEDPQS